MFRRLRRKIVRLALVSGAGAAASYFFDRERGPDRRIQAKEKAASLMGRPTATTDWQSNTANGFEPPPAAATVPASAPVDMISPEPPVATVTDITGTLETPVVPRSGPISTP